jgi:predicted nucleic acid-binding protein
VPVVAYADSSALTKLVLTEQETPDLRAAVLRWPAVATSALARVEISRAVARVAPEALARVEQVLEEVTVLELDDATLRRAAVMDLPALRALDAIHLASAERLGEELNVFVAYDERLLAVARLYGFPVSSPGRPPAVS